VIHGCQDHHPHQAPAAGLRLHQRRIKFGWIPKQEREAELKAQQTVKRMKNKERNDAGS
jgi:hypothetical protein